MTTDSRLRSKRLNVRLQEDMFDRLEVLASSLGMPAATVAALAIGQFVKEQNKVENAFGNADQYVRDAIKESTRSLTDKFNSPSFLAEIAKRYEQVDIEDIAGKPSQRGSGAK